MEQTRAPRGGLRLVQARKGKAAAGGRILKATYVRLLINLKTRRASRKPAHVNMYIVIIIISSPHVTHAKDRRMQ